MNNIIKRTWKQNTIVNIEDLRGMTFQAESGAHTFEISAVDADNNPITLSGTPSGTMLRPDNTDQALTCSISGGKLYATLPAGCYDVPGRAGITIFLTSDSQKTALYAAVVSVTRTQSGTAAPGTTASVVDLINAINAAIAGIPATDTAIKAAMAPTYSNSALYAVGQYAWYNGALKRCIVPITTAESYTAAHWTDAALGNDVFDLKSALHENVSTCITNIFNPANAVEGKFATGSVGNAYTESSNSNFAYCIIPVEYGQTYICTGINHKCYAIDDNGIIIKIFNGSASAIDNYFFTIDVQATRFIINYNKAYRPTATFMVAKGLVLPSNYVQYNHVEIKTPLINSIIDIPEIAEVITGLPELDEELDEQVEDINGRIPGYPSRNIFNMANAVQGKFLSGDTGEIAHETTNASYFYYVLPLEAGKTYIVTGTDYYRYYLDDDNRIVLRAGASSKRDNVTFGGTTGATKIAINVGYQNHPIDTYMICEGSILPSSYEPYNTYIFTDEAKNGISAVIDDQKTEIYYVGATREHTSIMGLFDELKDNSKDKIIYIDQGEYDIFNEIGGAEYCATIPADAKWIDVSILVPPNTSVIGVGRVVLNFMPEVSAVGNGINLLSPLNVTGAARIENIIINGKNCRYCIHDEKKQNDIYGTGERKRIYRNVVCNKQAQGQAQAFGGGLSGDTDYLFENCVFNGSQAGLSYHSNGDANGNNSRLNFINCVFIGRQDGSYPALRFGNVTWRQEPIRVFISNCYISGKMMIGLETDYGLQNFDITMTNCNKALIDIEIQLKEGDTNAFPPVVYQW